MRVRQCRNRPHQAARGSIEAVAASRRLRALRLGRSVHRETLRVSVGGD